MENMSATTCKAVLAASCLAVGGVAAWFGVSPTIFLVTMFIFGLDFITGVAVAATERGIQSGFTHAGKSIVKAVAYMSVLLLASLLGIISHEIQLPEWFGQFSANAVSLLIITNESISVIENSIKLGVPFPPNWLPVLDKFSVWKTPGSNK